jgi:hypothetical protein
VSEEGRRVLADNILERLGGGGMGVVYKSASAKNPGLQDV